MQERALMKDLLLRTQGIMEDDKPLNPFEGPQATLAFEQAIIALTTKQIPVDLQFQKISGFILSFDFRCIGNT